MAWLTALVRLHAVTSVRQFCASVPAGRPLPVEYPTMDINCNWHRRYDSDVAHAWLREQVRAAFAESMAAVQ